MKRNRKRHFNLAAAFLCFLLITVSVPVQAAENTQNGAPQENRQIVFLMDGSQSMSGERWQEALDYILMVEAMLPTGYQKALAVYNTEMVIAADFESPMEDAISGLRTWKQKGYTDPGTALETAMEMFDTNSSGEKYVILITDGEISLPEEEKTEAASESYLAAVAKAIERGIIVDVLLYETEDIEDRVSEGAALTGGNCFRRTQGRTAESFGENYLFERLGLERIMLGISDSPDNWEEVSLQDTYADRVKILLTTESSLQDIQVSCQSRKISTVQGEHFAAITLEHPLEDTVALQYALSEKGRINAYLVKEYNLSVSAEASYLPETGHQQIQVKVVNSEGKDTLEDVDVRNAVNIYIDGEKVPYEVFQGEAIIDWPAESSGEISLKADFSGLNSRVYCDNAQSRLFLEVPPPAEPVEDRPSYLWLWVVLAVLCGTLVILLCILGRSRKKKNKTSGDKETGAPRLNEILRHDFSGKLVVYILKTPDEQDIPPASINLFARESSEPFSFDWVRARCGIGYKLRDADKLTFSGGENHALCVRNKGDVTAVRDREILLRDKKYILNYDDKLFLIFNDGEIEIELHYKNMKPSERKG